jgi:cellulose synthase/poly-beta-1,6-N-acetylglucosamine synthase-like glycosyltransferase
MASRWALYDRNRAMRKVGTFVLEKNKALLYARLGCVPYQGQLVVRDDSPVYLDELAKYFGHIPHIIKASHIEINDILRKEFRDVYIDAACNLLRNDRPDRSASFLAPSSKSLVYTSILLLITFCMVSHHLLTQLGYITLLLNITNLVFNISLLLVGKSYYDNNVLSRPITIPPDATLPVYTVLVPLFREHKLLKQIIANINAIDYPKNKLDVKIVVEESDEATIQALEALPLAPIFEVVKVPFALPQTKPKACNYALLFAYGEYITIYDAEDVPDSTQLKKAVALFRSYGSATICLQALLSFHNYGDNIISACSAIEYKAWFNYKLPCLEYWHLIIPLGGTSNHLVVDKLRDFGGWDPYNVTEDAELGTFLVTAGYQTRILPSITYEAGPTSLSVWLGQRSRWIKGYMQTYLVYMQRPVKFFKQVGWSKFLCFNLLIFSQTLIRLLNPLVLIGGIVQNSIQTSDIMIALLAIHFIACTLEAVIGSLHRIGTLKSMWAIVIYPLYNLLHILAAFKALHQLIHKPFFWQKTNHGSG